MIEAVKLKTLSDRLCHLRRQAEQMITRVWQDYGDVMGLDEEPDWDDFDRLTIHLTSVADMVMMGSPFLTIQTKAKGIWVTWRPESRHYGPAHFMLETSIPHMIQARSVRGLEKRMRAALAEKVREIATRARPAQAVAADGAGGR